MTVRKLVFLFVLYNIIAIVCYLFIIAGGWNVIKTVNIHLGLRNATPSVFDTCPLKVLNHLDEELLHYHHPNYNPLKECRKYEPSVKLVSGQIVVPSNISNLACKARCILHKPGDFGFLTDDWVELPSNHTFTCDIVESNCDRDGTIELYLHMQIYEKETNSKQSSIEESSGNKTSRHDVYVIILDSVSSFMIKRSFPKTLKFLKEEMGAVQMEFLDKVGDNSRANAFPLAFGRSVQSGIRGLVDMPPIDPDWNDTEICAEPLDDYPFYLFQYAEVGYKTMTAQDYGVGFAFYPNCTGFIRDEADHVWVHFNNRRLNSTDFLMNRFRSCSERHLEMLEFLEKFMNAYPGEPKIAHVWPTELAHESLKVLYHADVHFLDFFKRNRAVIDRSFVFFMGDHGPRREDIGEVELGRYEVNNPFLLVSIPSEYRNTTIHEQLRNNRMNLMTHFDTHATLMDILKFQPSTGFSDTSYLDMEPISKGSSLFREWRGVRNCKTLPIPSQYCICQYDWKEVTNETLQQELGEFFAEKLNERQINAGLAEICHNHTFRSTLSIKYLVDNDATLYNVVVYMSPSAGIFSVYMRFTVDSGLQIASDMSRLDRYADQGKCQNHTTMQSLCYCVEKFNYSNS